MSLPILLALFAGGALLVVVVAVVALVLRDPEASKRRVEALFRRPRRPPLTPGSDHYYRPYWS